MWLQIHHGPGVQQSRRGAREAFLFFISDGDVQNFRIAISSLRALQSHQLPDEHKVT